MYRIRFHGRGGQGMKTASRILGSAFFAAGFEVQDAPRYGAERRGAPIFATVRAGRKPIHERGAIARPDLVVVADDTLVPIPAAGVTVGLDAHTVVLIASDEPAETWRERLPEAGTVLALSIPTAERRELRFVGASCAAAAARAVGAIAWEPLEGALRAELATLDAASLEANLARARAAWEAFEGEAGRVVEGPDAPPIAEAPDWVDVPADPVEIAAPDIHATATSVQVRTGLWRTMRPVIDLDRCRRCSWLCSTLCPDGAILVADDATPSIDLDHCKGCMICVAVCPTHAIESVPEREAARDDEARS
jgi:pyruvate ferredoxin oxidoreductase gamma subunit